MEKIREWMSQFFEWLNQQSWYQEVRARWDELDPQSQFTVRVSAVAVGVLVVGLFILSSIASTYQLKGTVLAKHDVLHLVQNANDEMRNLRALTGHSATESTTTPPAWNQIFETAAQNAGLPREALVVSPEKAAEKSPGSPAGTGSGIMKESWMDIQVQKTSIKKLIKFALELESQTTPIKIRNLVIDMVGADGYLNAKLAVSGFSLNKK